MVNFIFVEVEALLSSVAVNLIVKTPPPLGDIPENVIVSELKVIQFGSGEPSARVAA